MTTTRIYAHRWSDAPADVRRDAYGVADAACWVLRDGRTMPDADEWALLDGLADRLVDQDRTLLASDLADVALSVLGPSGRRSRAIDADMLIGRIRALLG